MNYKVNTTSLNLRREPIVKEGNIITTLHEGQIVQLLTDSGNNWFKVRLNQTAPFVDGYASSKYLTQITDPIPAPTPTPAHGLPTVHLKENDASVTRNNERRAFPLGEAGMPRRNNSSVTNKKTTIGQIIDFLNVESSHRYGPTTTQTYCNIYAYDYCYLSGVYIPRVWWTSKAISDLRAGKSVIPAYGNTVSELNANSLLEWFKDYSAEFGWKRVYNISELQAAANEGKICIISAQHKNGNSSGHIVACVPETDSQKAKVVSGVISAPLQSQAGRNNKKYFSDPWYNSTNFREFGFWIHD